MTNHGSRFRAFTRLGWRRVLGLATAATAGLSWLGPPPAIADRPPQDRPPELRSDARHEPLRLDAAGPAQPPRDAKPAPPPAAPPVPMARAAFTALLQKLQRRSFGDEKVALAREAARSGQYFSCEQVGQLMRTSAFGDEQVKIAAALYPRLVDPENLPRLISLVTTESDRDKLRQLLGR